MYLADFNFGQVFLLCSTVIAIHRDDDISLFVPFIDILVSLDNLFQRIALINDRL